MYVWWHLKKGGFYPSISAKNETHNHLFPQAFLLIAMAFEPLGKAMARVP